MIDKRAFYRLVIIAGMVVSLGSTPFMASAQEQDTSEAVIEENSTITSSFMGSYSTSDELKLISETTGWGRNHMGYAYIEVGTTPFKSDGSKWLYTQLMWEQKFWTPPLYLHAEVRSYFSNVADSYQLFGGLAYMVQVKNGYLAFDPLYRYCSQGGHGAQLTIFGAYDWKHFNFMHYTDIYKTHKMTVPLTMYNECRAFYKINRRFEVGLIGIFSYSFIDEVDALSLALAAKVNI